MSNFQDKCRICGKLMYGIYPPNPADLTIDTLAQDEAIHNWLCLDGDPTPATAPSNALAARGEK